MQKLLKFKVLITIVLLSYSINSFGTNHISSTGVVESDSVYVSYDDLRVVNSKLVELQYEKEINSVLKTIIQNDSIAINSLIIDNSKLTSNVQTLDILNAKYKKQRNIGLGVGIAGVISTILMLIK